MRRKQSASHDHLTSYGPGAPTKRARPNSPFLYQSTSARDGSFSVRCGKLHCRISNTVPFPFERRKLVSEVSYLLMGRSDSNWISH